MSEAIQSPAAIPMTSEQHKNWAIATKMLGTENPTVIFGMYTLAVLFFLAITVANLVAVIENAIRASNEREPKYRIPVFNLAK